MTSLALALRSDERLALQVAGGNDAAFDAIYRRYQATLFGYCRSITRNADDAGDALQNAMLKALPALRSEERSTPLRPWLFRIVHNEAVNQVTRKPLVAPPWGGPAKERAVAPAAASARKGPSPFLQCGGTARRSRGSRECRPAAKMTVSAASGATGRDEPADDRVDRAPRQSTTDRGTVDPRDG